MLLCSSLWFSMAVFVFVSWFSVDEAKAEESEKVRPIAITAMNGMCDVNAIMLSMCLYHAFFLKKIILKSNNTALDFTLHFRGMAEYFLLICMGEF